jgi:hypothetical protein
MCANVPGLSQDEIVRIKIGFPFNSNRPVSFGMRISMSPGKTRLNGVSMQPLRAYARAEDAFTADLPAGDHRESVVDFGLLSCARARV